MYTLYHAPGSSSLAVHIALHEVGAAFEGKVIKLNHRDQDPPEFRDLNPEGKVPTLVVDGRPLTEVAGILYYLAKRYPEAELFPDGDIEAEAQVVSWMSFIASTLHPARMGRTEVGRADLGGGRLFDRRYPPVPSVLAAPRVGRRGPRGVSRSVRPPRPDDAAAGGAADLRGRGGDRIRPDRIGSPHNSVFTLIGWADTVAARR